MITENDEIKLDYSNTIIYKITCKDPNITNIYIGHTINFCQRQKSHKYNCLCEKSSSYNCKLYKIIRQCGGWDNWRMDIVNFFNCTNKNEAIQKEQEYYISLNADLNSIEPFSNKTITKCKTIQSSKLNINEQFNLIQNDCKFLCNGCNYSTNRKSQYDRHLNTDKHKNLFKALNSKSKSNKDYTCICGKSYKYDSGYYRHKKNCSKSKIVANNTLLNNDITHILTKILETIKQSKIC